MWIPELEMYYYKARIYSYKLGRFMQTDPIGYEDQFNLYAYVGNDPVNLIDPTGLCDDIANAEVRATCDHARKEQTEDAVEYIDKKSVSNGNKEEAYIATFDEKTGAVSVRTGDEAAVRTTEQVRFKGADGGRLRATEEGRILEVGEDGGLRPTSKVILVTAHTHVSKRISTRDSFGKAMDKVNEGIAGNDDDQNLSKMAPAVIKTPSRRVKIFRHGKQVDER